MNKISLVIPSNNNYIQLCKLLDSINQWTLFPNEIIIVDSSNIKIQISEQFKIFCIKKNIILILKYKKNLYPGNARNLGIKNSQYNLIAFLDVNTFPSNDWLKSNADNLVNNKFNGIWGATIYDASNIKEKIIRAATYGIKPLKTLPGSIFFRDVFQKCGNFIGSVRAGEDQDWMVRVKLHNLNIATSSEYIIYRGLSGFNYLDILKKWFRNYHGASKLPYLRSHKDWYFYAISTILILVAFNWNAIMANWYSDSVFYIPHITKISISLILIAYIILRGFFYPLKKGLSLKFLFPFNFIKIIILSFALDSIKLFAFIYGKFK